MVSREVLTTIIGQRASVLQCIDRPIENALGLVKFGENWGYNRGRHYRILTPNELDLSFPTPNYCAKFHQILFKIATVGAMTDTHTERQTDRRQRSYNLSRAML